MSLSGPRIITGRRKLLRATLVGISGDFQRVRHQGAGAASLTCAALGDARRRATASGLASLAFAASGGSGAPTKSGAGSASTVFTAGGSAAARRSASGAGALLTTAGGAASARRHASGSGLLLSAAAGAARAQRFATGSAKLTTVGTGDKHLPVLPLALGARVAVHGDSQSGFNHAYAVSDAGGTDQLGVSTLAHGPMAWAQTLDPRFDFSTWYDSPGDWARSFSGANQGIPGDHLEWPDGSNGIAGGGTLARLDYTLAKGAQLVVFPSLGFNTINTGDPGLGSTLAARRDYVIAKLDAHLRKCRAAGRWAMISTLYPTDAWTAGDYRYDVITQVNDWIRLQSGREGVVAIIDPWNTLAPAGVLDQSLYQVDSGQRIHLSPKGAFIVGRDHYVPALASCIASGSIFDQAPATSNLLGATVGNLAGTGGSKAGATGSVADGCKVTRRRGTATIVASKSGAADPRKQVITITPANDGIVNQVDFDLQEVATGLPAAGQWIQAYAEIEVNASPSVSLTWLSMHVYDSVALARRASARSVFDSFSTYGLMANVGSRKFWAITPPLLVPAATFDRIQLGIQSFWNGTTADTPVITIDKPIIRVISDPRSAWGY